MRPICSVLAAAAIGAILCSSSVSADEPGADAQQIRQLIEQLDDDRFARRAEATAQLIKIGLAALPQLQRAAESGSAEVRSRARQIIFFTVTVKIRSELVKLSNVKQDAQIELGGMAGGGNVILSRSVRVHGVPDLAPAVGADAETAPTLFFAPDTNFKDINVRRH